MKKKVVCVALFPDRVLIDRSYSYRRYHNVSTKNLANLCRVLRWCPAHDIGNGEGIYVKPDEDLLKAELTETAETD